MFYVTSSDLLTADTAVVPRGAFLHGVSLIPAAAACSVIIYDNASAASGTVLAKPSGVANGASVDLFFNYPVCANKGIYADVSGSGAAFIVYYSLA